MLSRLGNLGAQAVCGLEILPGRCLAVPTLENARGIAPYLGGIAGAVPPWDPGHLTPWMPWTPGALDALDTWTLRQLGGGWGK